MKILDLRELPTDGSDDGADDEAVEGCAVVLLFSCVFVGGHRGALTSDE